MSNIHLPKYITDKGHESDWSPCEKINYKLVTRFHKDKENTTKPEAWTNGVLPSQSWLTNCFVLAAKKAAGQDEPRIISVEKTAKTGKKYSSHALSDEAYASMRASMIHGFFQALKSAHPRKKLTEEMVNEVFPENHRGGADSLIGNVMGKLKYDFISAEQQIEFFNRFVRHTNQYFDRVKKELGLDDKSKKKSTTSRAKFKAKDVPVNSDEWTDLLSKSVHF